MKKIISYFSITLILTLAANVAWACEVCQKNQPKGLENITHGPGPAGDFDYVISIIAVIIVAFTLFYSIKYLVKPKEDNPDHVKNIVLNQGF